MSAARALALTRPRIRVRLEPEFANAALLEELHAGWFTVHGERLQLGDPVDWSTNPSPDIEWHIVLHKFHHAPALVQQWRNTGETRHVELLAQHLDGWIAAVPPGFIAADVTGRRVRNWVFALALLDGAFGPLAETMEVSLREQVGWLRANLHAQRNHRTLELFAVFIAGVWLGEREWTDFAMVELLANAQADFLPDGVHVERSSHYHCIALRNLIEAVDAADDNGLAVPPDLRAIIARANRFAHALHKPDGMIPALSDADTGDYRAMLGSAPAFAPVESFPDGGYTVMRGKGSYLILDHGAIGEGNHGHLDCLSFECANPARSLIVDPGRYTYHEAGAVNWRAAFRGTRAHNLVQVDGTEQTLYRQGPKRKKIAGPGPEAGLSDVRDGGHWQLVRAFCQSAQYEVRHERSILMHDQGWWVIHDRLLAQEPHDYELLFQLDPLAHGRAAWRDLPAGPAVVSPDLLLVPLAGENIACSFEQGWVAPAYGVRQPAPRVVCRQRAANGWFATLLATGDLPAFAADAHSVSVGGETYGIAPC